MSKRRMTDAKWLEARGWTCLRKQTRDQIGAWAQHPLDESPIHEQNALDVQFSLDAAEERQAWAQFAAAALASSHMGSGPLLASHADDMLAEYRVRFSRDALLVEDKEEGAK